MKKLLSLILLTLLAITPLYAAPPYFSPDLSLITVDSLLDVSATSPSDDDVLNWNSSTSLWENTADITMNSVDATPSVGEIYEPFTSHFFVTNAYTSDLGAGDTLTETSGTFANTADIDDIPHFLTEINATPAAAIYTFNGTDTTDPVKVSVRLDYNGNHNMKMQAYNYNTPGWVSMTADATDFGTLMTDYDNYEFFFDPDVLGEPRSSFVNSSGEVRVRIDHPTNGIVTHEIKIDYIAMEKAALNLPVSGTAYTLTGLANGITATDITTDATNVKFTIIRGGSYYASAALGFESLASSTVHVAFYVNGVLIDKSLTHQGFNSGIMSEDVPLQAALSLVAGDYVEIKFWSDIDDNYIILHHANIIMHRLN